MNMKRLVFNHNKEGLLRGNKALVFDSYSEPNMPQLSSWGMTLQEVVEVLRSCADEIEDRLINTSQFDTRGTRA